MSRLREAGLRLAVIANWDDRLPGLLGELGLARDFEVVVTSHDVGVQKPHPTIFRTAAKRLGLTPEEMLHVGDRKLEDVEGAEAVGLSALWLTRGSAEGIHDLSQVPLALSRFPSA